jgi:hypothetical protein
MDERPTSSLVVQHAPDGHQARGHTTQSQQVMACRDEGRQAKNNKEKGKIE